MSKSKPVGTNSDATAWTAAHIDLVLSLPAPGEQYLWHDLKQADNGLEFDSRTDYVQKLRSYKAVKLVDVVHRRGAWLRLWETNADLYEFAKSLRAEQDTLPCTEQGHAGGFRTVDADAGVYECGVEWCTERYDRETVSEVFG